MNIPLVDQFINYLNLNVLVFLVYLFDSIVDTAHVLESVDLSHYGLTFIYQLAHRIKDKVEIAFVH